MGAAASTQYRGGDYAPNNEVLVKESKPLSKITRRTRVYDPSASPEERRSFRESFASDHMSGKSSLSGDQPMEQEPLLTAVTMTPDVKAILIHVPRTK